MIKMANQVYDLMPCDCVYNDFNLTGEYVVNGNEFSEILFFDNYVTHYNSDDMLIERLLETIVRDRKEALDVLAEM